MRFYGQQNSRGLQTFCFKPYLDMERLKTARPWMGHRRQRGLGEAEQDHLVVHGLGGGLGSNFGRPNPRGEELVS